MGGGAPRKKQSNEAYPTQAEKLLLRPWSFDSNRTSRILDRWPAGISGRSAISFEPRDDDKLLNDSSPSFPGGDNETLLGSSSMQASRAKGALAPALSP